MGTMYREKITSGEIGAAIAAAVIHDIRVNGLGVQGFPMIKVARFDSANFRITLSFDDQDEEFLISVDAAKRSVELLRTDKGHNVHIFPVVQEALAKLEGAVINRR